MSPYDHRFWLSAKEEYKNLAKKFEKNVEITHPNSIKCVVTGCQCSYCASNVKYIEHCP